MELKKIEAEYKHTQKIIARLEYFMGSAVVASFIGIFVCIIQANM